MQTLTKLPHLWRRIGAQHPHDSVSITPSPKFESEHGDAALPHRLSISRSARRP
ncbi:MAG: hypothetical protein U0703_11140 [Anaerolineae bacterium]